MKYAALSTVNVTVAVVRNNFDYLTGRLRPRWRGRLHATAAMISALAGTALVAVTNGVLAVAAVTVYVIGLFMTFAVSACYHLAARTRRAQVVMQRLDHSTIYLLIAGTYTPVCVLGLPKPWAWWLLAAIWAAAAVGAYLKAAGRGWRTGTLLYLVIGWSALAAVPYLWSTYGPMVVIPLTAGGVLYTVGAVLFLTGRPWRHSTVFGHHELWHAMTIAAGGSHFFAVTALTATTGHL